MSFIDGIKAKAKANLQTIVLPETNDVRTLAAAEQILKEGFAKIVLVGNETEIKEFGKDYDLAGAEFVNPADCDKFDTYVDVLVEARKKKGMTPEEAKGILETNPLFFGATMVKAGDADGMVAGAVNASADVLRAALQVVKTAPDTKVVSSFFVMIVPDCDMGANGAFVFSDCGLNIDPDAEQLAVIAASSAKSFELLVGEEAKVAMLSFSSMGSGKGGDVEKVVEATRIAKEQYPDMKVDGELQLDAAIVPAVGASKAPDSEIAGHANVLIFPDLEAGNIGYKLVQRLAKAEAYGPVTQGIAKPINDLSRGCSAEDIVGVVAITALQAVANK
ncbi:MAG: phosphate acetyltransferase [Lachnospiraceae bacterium]